MYGYERYSIAELEEERYGLLNMTILTEDQRKARDNRVTEIDWQLGSRGVDLKMVSYTVEFSGTVTVTGSNTAEAMKKLNTIIEATPNIVFDSIVISKK